MGKQQSKSSSVAGDPQVEIINYQEQKTSIHEENRVYLIVIVVLLAVGMGYALIKKFIAWQRREALRAARSLANLNDVAANR